ncbi:MAG: 23S rRNA (uracil(1939)-C(5))-methyltransferase RlmD [Dechloromonas sp.]|jgi:23S rRNA (uracil1939-C5)-methyltransferase|nr:23S rRNA (uracil(1939)-C(5))-methyltransferase RlmD [Dechloromonas sp.]
MPIAVIESVDREARGITCREGRTVFVDGALPGEIVEYASFRRKRSYEIAHLVRVHRASPSRVEPRCEYFGICGGCAMQHLDLSAQVAVKQRFLEDSLSDIGGVRATQMLPPVHGAPWGYRHRARLGVRNVPKRGGVLIGFHECRSSYIADMRSCAVLPPHVSDLLPPLRELVATLSVSERLPQIEAAVGEECTALVLRILEPLTGHDEGLLRGFADRHGIVFYLQPRGPDTAVRFHPVSAPGLSYLLPEFGLEYEFRPTDFTQVNHAVNRILVRRAMGLLDPQPGERVADLFCGLGNFTLPIACSGASVIGVEGNRALVERGRETAVANGLADRAEFRVANLFACTPETLAALGQFDRMLIDPPREGAIAVVKALPADGPRRIVYVSCNPATLARDAAVLVHVKGYSFRAAGVVNMFPQTGHVESVAVFERA